MNVTLVAQATAHVQPAWFWPTIITLSVCIAVGLLLVYPAMVLRKYIRIMINIMDDHAPHVENGTWDGAGLQGERVSFRSVDGHRLDGLIISGQGAKGNGTPAHWAPGHCGMIVFSHEFGSDLASGRRYCHPLLQAGYDVFSFDYRGHGTSPPGDGYRPRQWPSDRERADMLGAIAFIGSWLEARGRPRDVGLFGISRGGSAAILASVGISAVKAIVTDGAFSSDTTMEYLMRRFATIFAKIRIVAENHPRTFWRFLRWLLFRECRRKFHCQFPSVRKAIVKVGRKPILLIHGEKDSYIPVAQSQALFDLADGPKYLWLVPGATHNQSIIVAREEYARRVLRFFDEHLSAGPASVDRATVELRSVRPAAAPSRRVPTAPETVAAVTPNN